MSTNLNVNFYKHQGETLTEAEKSKLGKDELVFFLETDETDKLTGNLFVAGRGDTDLVPFNVWEADDELIELYDHLVNNWIKKEGISIGE